MAINSLSSFVQWNKIQGCRLVTVLSLFLGKEGALTARMSLVT